MEQQCMNCGHGGWNSHELKDGLCPSCREEDEGDDFWGNEVYYMDNFPEEDINDEILNDLENEIVCFLKIFNHEQQKNQIS